MNFYKVFDFCLASEIELPVLAGASSEADISEADIFVKLGKIETLPAERKNSQDIVGEISHVARFLFCDGREITVDPMPGIDLSLLQSAVLGPALCLLLEQRGLLVLHASCVNIDGCAVAFMGGAGWGKSTLATAFHCQGYDVLTDDVMPIQITDGQAIVLPSYPQFKVSPEALISLGQGIEGLSPVYTDSQKLSYQFTEGFQASPLRLKKIYVLNKGIRHKIASINPQEAFGALVCHTRAINLLKEHKPLIARHFRLCTELVSAASFSRFTRKPALADLPELIELVKADIAATVTVVSSPDLVVSVK
jgi:hypothetical protein